MSRKAAVTINRPRQDVERLWRSSEHGPKHIGGAHATVRFVDAPGDRGTEIHVDLDQDTSTAPLGGAVKKLTGSERLAKVKDDLRRFKQYVETGVIPRSDGSPEGERAERKLKQRPAQPLEESELQEAGV